MSETPQFNPTEEPASGNEHFRDTDPIQESISRIHQDVLHLAKLDKQTRYRREYEIILNSDSTEPYGPISVSAEATGSIDNLDGSNFRIILPPETYFRETGGAFKWETTLTFEKAGDQAKARVMLDPALSPKEAFARVLERDDLPQELATIIVEIAGSLVSTPHYDASGMNLSFPITDEQYKRYWQEVQTAMNNQEVSTPVTMTWDTNHWNNTDINEPSSIPLPNGEILVGASLEAVEQADRTIIKSVNLNTRDYYFFFSLNEPDEPDDEKDDDRDTDGYDEDKQGTLYDGNIYLFQEFIKDTLPELTNEERRHNPYMIIPTAMNMVSLPSKEGSRHIAASPDYTAAPDAADDFGPAQSHAELLYKKKLAHERSSFAFNPARAERVTETLAAVLSILKQKYPDSPEGAKQ